jgi:hypothetical protein
MNNQSNQDESQLSATLEHLFRQVTNQSCYDDAEVPSAMSKASAPYYPQDQVQQLQNIYCVSHVSTYLSLRTSKISRDKS